MSKEGHIGAVPNQPLILNSPTDFEIAEFSVQSNGRWFAEPSKSLDPMLAKKLMDSPKPQETK